MNSTLKFAFGATALAFAAQACAQVTFYEGEGFRGRTFATAKQVEQLNNLDQLYPQVDFLTVHMPKTHETKGMVNAPAMSKMKKGARV